jgi:peptide-methionine (S)-S-oxide reductase
MVGALLLTVAVGAVGQSDAMEDGLASAVFAGGCFWCMEKPFDHLDGVVSTTSGYAGGHVVNPTYDQVSAGGTGHSEVVRVVYDPNVVSYEELLYVYWRNVDPFDSTGQFCDHGPQYRPIIFYQTTEERSLANLSAERVAQELGNATRVEIRRLNAFYPAEDYHQDYYIRNPVRYTYYRARCGRDRRLDAVWGEEARGEHPYLWLTEAM